MGPLDFNRTHAILNCLSSFKKEVGAEVMREKVTGFKAAVVEEVDMADVVVVVKEVGGV